jgi:ribosomal protein S18 acetylase RimI-like enzyme
MATTLEPMSAAEVNNYRDGHQAEYIAERIAAGEHPDDANSNAVEQFEMYFPNGGVATGHLHFRVVSDSETVGSLWIGPRLAERPESFWVWSVEIDEEHRRKGLGRAAMQLAEEAALDHGATELGLNVFGHNTVARQLYESLDYQTTALQMRKELSR